MKFYKWLKENHHKSNYIDAFFHYVEIMRNDLNGGHVRPPLEKSTILDWILFTNQNSAHYEFSGGLLLAYYEYMIDQSVEDHRWVVIAENFIKNYKRANKFLDSMDASETEKEFLRFQIESYLEIANDLSNKISQFERTLYQI